jgi:hypothetical protein
MLKVSKNQEFLRNSAKTLRQKKQPGTGCDSVYRHYTPRKKNARRMQGAELK